MSAPRPAWIGDPKLETGRLVATPHALCVIPNDEIQHALGRHIRGDWGELDRHDWNANEMALITGARLFSSYRSSAGTRFWIITEADRASTCILLPEDY